jgi:cytochrome c5
MKPFLIVILALLGATTCACSSSGPAAQPGHTVTMTAHAAASRSVAPAPHPSPPTSLVAARCQTGHLTASAGAPQGYRSGLQLVITFKNTSTAACTLHGWPRVWQSAGPPVTTIGPPAAQGPVPAPTVVTLPPNGTASARLQIEDSAVYPTGTCKPVKATSLAVIPPGENTATHISFGSTACKGSAKLMTVTTVVQGSGG